MKRWFFRARSNLWFALLFAPAAMAANAFDVYSDPSCGCCGTWVEYIRGQGYTVTVHQDQPMGQVKMRYGVPRNAMSCHTAVIEGYVVEGHVPVEDIRRLLAERPDAIGLAAPGMPMGSPGMEMAAPERYDVVLIGRDGSARLFASHGPGA